MSTTLFVVIGILIAALGTTLGFVYCDMDSGSALEGGLMASQGITSLEQSAAAYSAASGIRPVSLDEIKETGGLPDLPNFPGAAWSVGNGFVCLYGDHGTIADRALLDGSRRLGSKAALSGECGGTAPPGKSVVLSYPMAPVKGAGDKTE